MPSYVYGYVGRVADVQRLFQEVIIDLQKLEQKRPGTAAARLQAVKVAYRDYNDELDAIAIRFADLAQSTARRTFRLTAKRPDTGTRPHLVDRIDARPLKFGASVSIFGTGSVGIGDIKRLDSVTNPRDPSSTPYWKVQEEGTRKLVGRTIQGLFFGTGGSGPGEGPRAIYAPPNPRGPHPIFVAGKGGKGVIRRPIAARHFLRSAASETFPKWEAAMAAAEAKAVAAIAAAAGAPKPKPVRAPLRVTPRRP